MSKPFTIAAAFAAAAVQSYHNHVNGLWADTSVYRSEVHDAIARGRGDNLSGTHNYLNPQTGTFHTLPYTVPAHSFQYQPSTGNTFYMDGQSNYWGSNGTGWWSPMSIQD